MLCSAIGALICCGFNLLIWLGMVLVKPLCRIFLTKGPFVALIVRIATKSFYASAPRNMMNFQDYEVFIWTKMIRKNYYYIKT
ncbi:Uncharacterised protein [uncultured archaeon]|nr:Uncharacterised protein [uncultured archaeon]